MNEHDQVIELLKNYRSYQMAILNYQRHKPSASAGIANYGGMPSGSGAPELFFDSVGKRADMGFSSALDLYDYETYRDVVMAIDFTVTQILTDDEQLVIRKKYLERIPVELYKIAMDRERDESTIRRWHRKALRKLAISLCPMFVVPKIERIAENARFMPA